MSEQPNTELEILLMQRAGEGDQGSFTQLYERFSGVLFTTALNVLGNQEAAEDVMQDVFIAIWEKAPLYDSERGKPLTWAVTLARHKAIDRLRSIHRKGSLHERAEQERKLCEEGAGRSSLEEADSAERAKTVREALRQLSPTQRQVIELAFFAGLTHAEIAARLQEPLGTVKARSRRGLARLRQIVSLRL